MSKPKTPDKSLALKYGWGSWIWTNEWRDQNPLPYRLAIPQQIMVRKERLELSRREALEPKSSVSTNSTTSAENGVDDGIWTHDNRNHNPGLYQLSYAHHWGVIVINSYRF